MLGVYPHGPYVFWVQQQRFDEFQLKLASFQRDVTEPRNPYINIFKAVEKPAMAPAAVPQKSKRGPKFGRVPKAGAFVLKPADASATHLATLSLDERKQTKYCPITLHDALRNNDIRAFTAVVAADWDRLNKIDFHPHLVFELVLDNPNCVEFLLIYLRGVSLNRRHDLFDCKIAKNESFKILKQCGVPAVWLRNSPITQTQRAYLWSIGYTEIAESASEDAGTPLSQIPDSDDSDNEGDEKTEKTLVDHIPILGHKDSPCIQQ